MKKFITVLLAISLVAGVCALSGCSHISIDENALNQKTIATVNGEEIKRLEWYNTYSMWAQYYESMGYSQEQYPTVFESLKTDILEELILNKVIEQKAKAAGYFEYTQEQRDEATKQVEEAAAKEIKSKADELYNSLEGNTDRKEYSYYEQLAKEWYDDQLLQSKTTKDTLIDNQLKTNAMDKFKEDNLSTITVTEAEVITKYDELKKSQNEEFITGETKDYAAFVTAWKGTDPIIVTLDSYSLVQHILVSYADADKTAVSTAASTMTTAKTALDKVTKELTDLEAATEKDQTAIDAKKTEVATAQTTYDTAKAEYDKARKTAEDAGREAAQAVLDKVKDADEAKFIEVILSDSDDTGMNTEELAKDGYLVGNEDGMVEEFHNAAIALEKDGDISGLVPTDYGFHIIRRIKAVEEGTRQYSELHDELEESLVSAKKDTEWETMRKDWRTESVVKITESLMSLS